jgi:ABC-type multidrug transport system fused ATPase/permease subunit
MTTPISDQTTVGLRDYFTIELKQLKKNPEAQEHLTEELPLIIAAIANREPSVELDRTRIDLQKLDTRDLFPLMKVANRFFSTQHEGILNSSLLENLYTIEKRYSLEHFKTLVERTEAALTMSNEPNLQVENTQGIKEVKNKIIEANQKIERAEKQRKYAKIILIAGVASMAVGLGILITGMALLTGGAVLAAILVGSLIFSTGLAGAAMTPIFISKKHLDFVKKDHAYWTYVLTFSQTEDFQKYMASAADSLQFLEAAALTHLRSKNLLDRYQELRLAQLEKQLGAAFTEQNQAFAYSKTKDFDDFKSKYATSYHSDPDFIKFAYLESLETHTRKQTTEYEELLKKFSGG